MLYTDEDKVTTDLDEYFSPNFKPDFNLDMLRANNYICHFFVAKKALIESVGKFRAEYNGAQDYDLILRCTEQAERISHVAKILYHWRVHKESTADNPLRRSPSDGKSWILQSKISCDRKSAGVYSDPE